MHILNESIYSEIQDIYSHTDKAIDQLESPIRKRWRNQLKKIKFIE